MTKRKRLFACAAVLVLCSGCAAPRGVEPDPTGPAVHDVHLACDRWPDCTSLEQFGRDAIRIENAKTAPEKAIAVFRWIRRATFRGTPPLRLMRYTGHDRALAMMNLYGYAHCDGNAYICYMVWRCLGKPGHKVFLPKYGHTQAHLWWVDPDGVGRFHWFDVSKGTYLYVRDGSRLAGADDLWRDPSLHARPSKTPVPLCDRQDTRGWIRCLSWSSEPLRDQRWPGITLADGQTYVETWSDVNRFIDHANTMADDVAWAHGTREFGAYAPRAANSTHTFRAVGAAELAASLAAPPVNIRAGAAAGRSALVPAQEGARAEAVWLVQTRGGIVESKAKIELAAVGAGAGRAVFSTSTDGGKRWSEVRRETVSGPARVTLDLAPPAVGRGWGARRPAGSAYAGTGYRLKVELRGAALASLKVDTLVQQNQFGLPQLRPGRNRISVKDGAIRRGRALRVTYVWDDQEAKGRRHVAHVETLPFEYTIATSADDVRAVRCKELRTEVVAATGNGNRVLEDPKATLRELRWDYPPMDRQIGVKPPPKLKTEDEYAADLKSPDLGTRLHAARMLGGIATPKSVDALIAALRDVGIPEGEEERKYGTVRSWVAAALAHTKDARAVPALIPYINKGSKWDQTAAVYALAALGDKRATGPLMKKYRAEKRNLRMGWTILRALAILGDRNALPLLREAVASRNLDVAYAAATALLAMPDAASVAPLVERGFRRNGAIPLIYACRLVGTLRAKDQLDAMVQCLGNRQEEEVRGYAAWALGRIGDPAAVPKLRERLDVERSEWVRDQLRSAIAALAAK